MRISVATVCAFVSLFAKDLTQQAIAMPILPAVDKAPKAEAQTAPVHPLKSVMAIANPEPPQIERSQTPEATAPTVSEEPAVAPGSVVVEIESAIEVPALPAATGDVLPENTTPPSPLDEFDPNPNPLQSPTSPEEVQTRRVVPITLEQALDLARRNSLELRVAQLELERTQAALQESQSANLPTVDTSADLSAQPTNRNSGGIDAVLGGSIEVNYDVYTSGRRSAQIRASEGQVRVQALQVEVISQTIQLDVTNAYYDLQEADEQVNIAQAALEQAQQSLRDAIALEQAGVGTRFDRLQTEVDVANSRQELVLALSRQQSVRRQIKRRLNINEAIGVSAADPVTIAGTWNSGLEDTIVLAYQNRAELEQQLVQREIGQAQQRAALAELEPQVSVFTNYNAQNSLLQGGFDDNYQLGARVRMRLFDGGAAQARAAQQAANVAIAETRFADTRDQVRLEVEEAYLSLQSNLENTQTASQAVEAADTALRLARLRFQAGVATQADVSRLQTELTRAQGNRLQTILGYNRALSSLQRAVNQIDDRTTLSTRYPSAVRQMSSAL